MHISLAGSYARAASLAHRRGLRTVLVGKNSPPVGTLATAATLTPVPGSAFTMEPVMRRSDATDLVVVAAAEVRETCPRLAPAQGAEATERGRRRASRTSHGGRLTLPDSVNPPRAQGGGNA